MYTSTLTKKNIRVHNKTVTKKSQHFKSQQRLNLTKIKKTCRNTPQTLTSSDTINIVILETTTSGYYDTLKTNHHLLTMHSDRHIS